MSYIEKTNLNYFNIKQKKKKGLTQSKNMTTDHHLRTNINIT